MKKLEEAGKLASTLAVDRSFSLPGILLGTSAFTAAGWERAFLHGACRRKAVLAIMEPTELD
jgi:hypothetical protein